MVLLRRQEDGHVHRVTCVRVSQQKACCSFPTLVVVGLWSRTFETCVKETRPEPYLLLDASLLLLVEGVTAAELGLSVLQFPGLVGREQSLC